MTDQEQPEEDPGVDNVERANEILAGLHREPTRAGSGTTSPARNLDDPGRRHETARAEEAELGVKLQKALAIFAIVAMGTQILIADLVFGLYGWFHLWHIPPAAIIAWLSATVIEVIGLVLVITQRLFPTRKPTK